MADPVLIPGQAALTPVDGGGGGEGEVLTYMGETLTYAGEPLTYTPPE